MTQRDLTQGSAAHAYDAAWRTELDERIRAALNADPLFRHENSKELAISATPHLLTAAKLAEIYEAARLIDGALGKAIGALTGEGRDRRYAHHEPFAELNAVRPRHGRRLFLSRYDFIMDMEGRFKFIEFNTSCPAGVTFLAKWRQVVATHSVASPFPIGQAMPLDDHLHFARKLLSCLRDHYDAGPHPHVALVNDNAKLTLELANMAETLRALGATATICNLAELTDDGRRLRDPQGRAIDGLYCKVRPTPSLLRGWDQTTMQQYAPFLRACLDDRVCVLNPFPAMTIGEDKAVLASMHQPAFRARMTPEERASVAQHVARTWFVDPSDALNVEFLLAHRERLILKPRMESRGRFILLGRDLTPESWEQAIAGASNGQWIAQETLESQVVVDYSAEDCGEAAFSQTMAVFVVDHEPAGVFSRISRSSVNNVGSGGKIQATFVTD